MKNTVPVILILLFVFTGCRNNRIYIHDRHIFSYEPVKEYCEKHKHTTLVLLDYHNDIHPTFNTLNSITWVGKLFEEKLITDLIWVSGRTMEKPNRDARLWWLQRNTKDSMPELEQYILDHTKIIDYHDLKQIRMKGNFVITLDFDILMKDPGPEPKTFVTELSDWISLQKPELLTLALSAAYHKNNQAWNYFKIFLKNYKSKADWFITCDSFGVKPESNDETSSWEKWNLQKNYFQTSGNSYYPGAYLWVKAPVEIKKLLLEKNVAGTDLISRKITDGWVEELQNEGNFPSRNQIENWNDQIKKTLQDFFAGEYYPVQENSLYGNNNSGIAVRLINDGLDRGCLSLYSNVTDFDSAVKYCTAQAATDPRYRNVTHDEIENLDFNLSIFTEWKTCSDSLDFIPGLHSLLLITPDGEKTLLQPSIALERNYTQERFLETLCKKAGLDRNAWKSEEIKFQKSVTFNYYKWH